MTDSRARVVAETEAWVSSPGLADLVATFGGALPAGDLSTRLTWLDEFSDRWDTRQGAERNLAGELTLTAEQDQAVARAAEALGMIDPAPPSRGTYDHLLVLGGLIRACFTRPAYASHLRASGIQFGRISALGGHRPFQGDEFALAARAGFPDLAEEYTALDAGMRAAFALDDPVDLWGEKSDQPGGTWGVRRYRLPDDTQVDVAAAPSSDPAKRRANTPDTYAWFARELAALEPGQSILAVTTPIYVPAQQAAAERMLALPYGVEVETVGHDPRLVPESLRQEFSSTKYLLEMRSAFRSMRSLVDEATGSG